MYRAEHISDDEVLKQAIVPPMDMESSHSSYNSQLPKKTFHPELQDILKKSKYKGVKYDTATGSWYVEGMQRMFVNEEEAAQQAYLQTKAFHQPANYDKLAFINPPPGLGGGVKVVNDRSSFGSSDSFSMAVPVYYDEPITIESPEEKLARRKAQLVAFYSYWDPEKPEIEAHVENLFVRHDFRYIMRAVKTKYGVVPPGWEEEVEKEDLEV